MNVKHLELTLSRIIKRYRSTEIIMIFRADVLITQPIEAVWRDRNFESIDKIKWTNVGLRSGVFRTYPGHRSTRGYDPTQ
jgi:hypothetical protein